MTFISECYYKKDVFQALLDHTKGGLSAAEIVLVVSNVAGVKGLERAQNAGVATKVRVY